MGKTLPTLNIIASREIKPMTLGKVEDVKKSLQLNFRHHSFTSSFFLDWRAFGTTRRTSTTAIHPFIYSWCYLSLNMCKPCPSCAEVQRALQKESTESSKQQTKEGRVICRQEQTFSRHQPPPWQFFQCLTLFSKQKDQSYRFFFYWLSLFWPLIFHFCVYFIHSSLLYLQFDSPLSLLFINISNSF